MKRAHSHPQGEHHGADEQAEAELQPEPVEAQNNAENDENFKKGWNGRILLVASNQ